MDKPIISLWRNTPPLCKNNKRFKGNSDKCVFPSARQALTYGLKYVGLTRSKRIALPEWSSSCVIFAVGEVSTPIPIIEVLQNNIPVDAVLLYEQWGWQMPSSIKSKVLDRFKNSIIIIDRVDSADISSKSRIQFYPEAIQLDIISYWKILGLSGGGEVKMNGKSLIYEPNSKEEALSNIIWTKNIYNKYSDKMLHVHKCHIEALHPALKNWLSKNDLNGAIRIECTSRQKNLNKIANSNLSSCWGKWMFDAVGKKNAPNIVPILRGQSLKKLRYYQNLLSNIFNIETNVYHFNWSGDPMNPKYERTLALPTHGLMNGYIDDIVEIFK